MLTAKIENDELIYDGEVKVGDIYPSYCCDGFGWEVCIVYVESDPDANSFWGRCQNPNCFDFDGINEDDPYRGVSSIEQVDFACMLIDGKSRQELRKSREATQC